MIPKKVLILSPHPDDAEIGCGGFINKLNNNNHTAIEWVVFSTCDESLPIGCAMGAAVREHNKVINYLGLKSTTLTIPVRKFPEYRQEILETLIAHREGFNPDLVVCPTLGDLHQDHRTVAEEAVRAFKCHASIIGYELPADHLSFTPNLFVEISEYDLDEKGNMFSFYESQLVKERQWNNFDYIRSVARLRGTTIGVEYAEAFEIYRWRI
jgi:LmbE family N-acetylglucosaminyl deacetylase